MSMHACNEYCEMSDDYHHLQKDLQYDAFEQDGSPEWYEKLRIRLVAQGESVSSFLEVLDSRGEKE